MDSSIPAARRTYDSDRRPHPFVEEWLELFRFRHLLWQWSERNLTLRYKRSVLGVFWTLLEPLMIMTILTVVFSALFRFQLPNYAVYVLVGFSMWDFFRRATLAMIDEVGASQNLSTRIYLPLSTFAVAAVLTYLVNWILTLVPLAVIMLAMNHPLTPALLALPIAMAVVAVFTLGLGLIVATLAAFFPDVGLIYQVLLTALMYGTPIIYPASVVPERFQWMLAFNPLAHMVDLVRQPVYDGRLPAASEWGLTVALGGGLLIIGWWIFTHNRDAFGYRQ